MCLPTNDLRNEILDHVSEITEIHFKNQQIGDPELTISEKKDIAEKILNKSVSLFLSRFGNFLTYEQIKYFTSAPPEDQYAVNHFLKMHKKHKVNVNHKTVRNRRFEAMKQLLEEGSYFSESEMKSRNPLLYEHLVGQYLTPDEKEDVNRIDTTNMTFVKILLKQIDKDDEEIFKQKQIEKEETVEQKNNEENATKSPIFNSQQCGSFDEMEFDSSDDEENHFVTPRQIRNINEEVESSCSRKTNQSSQLWGEEMSDKPLSTPVGINRASYVIPSVSTQPKQQKMSQNVTISEKEKSLLFEEFRTNMFSNFLEGKEQDFDYSNVDSNPAYDDLKVNTQEAEEKYFDESEEVSSNSDMQVETNSHNNTDSEDELDVFMNNLKPEILVQDINSRMRNL